MQLARPHYGFALAFLTFTRLDVLLMLPVATVGLLDEAQSAHTRWPPATT